LVQLLHAVGANVIGTASTEDKLASARKAGATHTFLSTLPDDELIAKIKELSRQPANEVEEGEKPEEGVHAVFDGVGKVTFELDLAVVRRKGTIVSFGNASGAVDPVPLT
jgi:NADPH2:quinone reductase